MNDKESGDMDPDSLLNQLQSQDQPQYKHSAGQLNIKNIRERFLNALKEVSRLEKVLEEKNTLLAISAKEKDRLINALNKAFEDRKRLHDRLSDFDILRNMEIAELRQGIEEIMSGRNRLLKENEDLVEDIFERDKTIDELRYTIEKKELQLQEVQTDMYTAFETLKGIESRYKELEVNYKVIEQEKDNLREKLNAAIDQQETGVSEETEEYRRLLEISTSEKEAVERQLSGLREQMASDIAGYQTTIEKLTSEKDELNLRVAEAEKELALIKEENIAIEALREVESRYKELEVNYKVIEQERVNLEKDLQLKEQEIEDLKSRHDADIKRVASEMERSTAEKAELETGIKGIKEELARHKKSLDISNTEKETIKGQLKEATEKISSLEDKNNDYLSELSSKDHLISELKMQRAGDIAEYQTTIEKLTAEKDELNLKLTEAGKELALIKEENIAIEALREVESRYKELEVNYKVIEQERINFEKTLQLKDEVTKNLKSQYDADAKRLELEIERLTDEKSVLETDIKEVRGELEKQKKFLDLSDAEKHEIERRLSETLKDKDNELNLKLTETNKELILLKEENEALKGKLSSIAAHDLTQKAEAEAEARNKIDELNKAITDLKATVAGVPKKSKFYLFSGLAVCIVVMAGLWLFNIIETKRFDAEMSKLNKQKIEPQQKIMLPPPVPAAISVGEEILDAMEKSPKWTSAISEILAVVPEDVRLSSIESSEIRRGEKEDKGITQVNIKGFSTTEFGIADLVSALKTSHYFYDVEIVSSQKGEKDIAFELKTSLR